MNHFSPSLYIVFCITNSRCMEGPNSCISRDGSGEKKVKLAYLSLKKSLNLRRPLTSKYVIYHGICHMAGRPRQSEWESEGGGGKKNHNWSFLSFFHYFLAQALSTKSKCPLYLSRREEHLWAELRGASEIDGARIRSEWVPLPFYVNKRLYGFEVINHNATLFLNIWR